MRPTCSVTLLFGPPDQAQATNLPFSPQETIIDIDLRLRVLHPQFGTSIWYFELRKTNSNTHGNLSYNPT